MDVIESVCNINAILPLIVTTWLIIGGSSSSLAEKSDTCPGGVGVGVGGYSTPARSANLTISVSAASAMVTELATRKALPNLVWNEIATTKFAVIRFLLGN